MTENDNIDNAEFNLMVSRIVHSTSDAERRRFANEAVAHLWETSTFRRWAESICRRRGYRDRDGINDVEQVIVEKVLRALQSVTPGRSDKVSDWLRFLHGLSVNAVKDYLVSAQVTPASRMSGVMRRRDIIARVSKTLVHELGRAPRQDEIITAANAWASEHHKDAARQGLRVTEDDFTVSALPPASIDAVGFDGAASDSAELSSEVSLAVRRIREVCTDLFPEDENLLSVFAVWAQCVADGERPSQAAISRETSLNAASVRRSMANLATVLDDVRDVFA